MGELSLLVYSGILTTESLLQKIELYILVPHYIEGINLYASKVDMPI